MAPIFEHLLSGAVLMVHVLMSLGSLLLSLKSWFIPKLCPISCATVCSSSVKFNEYSIEKVIMCEIDCVLDAPQQWKLVSWRIRWWKFGNLWIGWRRRSISSKLFLACRPGCCGRKRGQKHPCHCRLRRGRPHDSSTSWVNLDKNVF